MDGWSAFRPGGRQFLISTQSSTAGSAVQASSRESGEISYLFYNQNSAMDVFVGFGMTASEAETNAAVPTAGNAKSVLPLPAGTLQTYTLNPKMFFATIGQAVPGATLPGSTSNVFITPGDGI